MSGIRTSLTVYFEDPFWVGVYEVHEGDTVIATKVTFGSEPKDYQIYDYFFRNWSRLRYGPPVPDDGKEPRRVNPKRMQRQIQRALSQTGVGTKAQQALAAQRQEAAAEAKARKRQRSKEEKEAQFELRQKKKKEKHKGR